MSAAARVGGWGFPETSFILALLKRASPSFDRGRMNLQRIQFTGNGRLEQNSNGNGLTAVLYDQGYKYTVLRWFCCR
jgi:hypothetical protein